MIGKIIAGSSFGATVGYVMNRCGPEDGEGRRAESIVGQAGTDKTEQGKVQLRIWFLGSGVAGRAGYGTGFHRKSCYNVSILYSFQTHTIFIMDRIYLYFYLK